jgi:spermidine synthase
MRRYAPHLLSFLVGYISLSQEILWFRIYGFTNHSLPQAFGVVVCCYLVGIAFGAEIGKRFCNRSGNLWRVAGFAVAASLALDIVCFSLLLQPRFLEPEVALFSAPLFMILVAGGKAVLFPIAHHLGTTPENGVVGRSMSKVYICNILGSTQGPLVTGLFLLNYLSTQQCVFLLLGILSLTSCFCFTIANAIPAKAADSVPALTGKARWPLRLEAFLSFSFAAAAFACVVVIREQLFYKLSDAKDDILPSKVFETKNGVVGLYGKVSGEPDSDDAVLGGNVYDGRTNLSLTRNTNQIDRAVILSAVQPHPKRVLEIGLSIGTWLTIVDTFPGVESVDVVEINEGYLKAIPFYPEQRRALLDPRVHLYIDDGNRWLMAHPRAQYDLIVMNTTYYWRNFASNLLSREFLELVSSHMAPGAVLTYNSTESPDVLKTASSVFKYARRRKSFILASDHDLSSDLHSQESFDRVFSLQLESKRLFPESSQKLLRDYIDVPLVTAEEEQATAGRPLEIITQDNMLTEFKYGRSLFAPIAGHMYRKLTDYVALIGRPKGPLRVELSLPTSNMGGYEPLVVVPNRDGGAVVIIAHYADPTHVRIGYFQTGMIHKFTGPIETDYAKPHTLVVDLAAILPPVTDSNAYKGWTPSAIEASRQQVILSWDGKEVFRTALDFGIRDNWYGPAIGVNQVVSGVSQTKFTGNILGESREPLSSAAH